MSVFERVLCACCCVRECGNVAMSVCVIPYLCVGVCVRAGMYYCSTYVLPRVRSVVCMFLCVCADVCVMCVRPSVC